MNARLNPRHLIDVVNGGESPSSVDSDVLTVMERASSAIALLIVGAIVLVQAHFGFYINWFGQQKGKGFEYHLLAIGLAVAVLVRGAGSFSIDGLLSKSMAVGVRRKCL